MTDQPQFFSGLKVRRLSASGSLKLVVTGYVGILGLLIAALIISALMSSEPLDRLLVPGVVIVLFGSAWWMMRWQSKKTLVRLDAVARKTGLDAAATAGLVPGPAHLPQVYGAFPFGTLEALPETSPRTQQQMDLSSSARVEKRGDYPLMCQVSWDRIALQQRS